MSNTSRIREVARHVSAMAEGRGISQCPLCRNVNRTGGPGAPPGTLRLYYPQRVISLDPQGTAAAERISIILGRHLYDTLVTWDPRPRSSSRPWPSGGARSTRPRGSSSSAGA